MVKRKEDDSRYASINSPEARREQELATRAELKRRGIKVIDGELSASERRGLAENFKRDHPEVLASIRSTIQRWVTKPKEPIDEAGLEDELIAFHLYCSRVGIPRTVDAGKAFDDIVDECLIEVGGLGES